MKITDYCGPLAEKDGIWYAEGSTPISFPEANYNKNAQIEDRSFWFRHRNQCIVDLAKKFVPNQVFWDIGGGNGFVTKGLTEAGFEAVLVEPGIQAVLNAKKRELPHIICSTFQDIGIKETSISALGFFDVLEHIDDQDDFLSKIRRLLRPDGMVFLTVPAYQFLWSREDIDAGHFRRYTRKKLHKVLKNNGFNIVFSSHFFSVLPIPVFLMRSLPSRLGFNKNSDSLEKHQREHQDNGLLVKLMEKVWRWELLRIWGLKPIPFGGSLLVVCTPQKSSN